MLMFGQKLTCFMSDFQTQLNRIDDVINCFHRYLKNRITFNVKNSVELHTDAPV